MSSFESVLAQIPGVGGYEAASQVGQQRTLGALQQTSSLMGIIEQARQRGAAQQYRNAISALPAGASEDQLLQAARPFMGPDALSRMLTSSQDRKSQIAATREAAIARLAQAAKMGDQNFQIRVQTAKTAQERAAAENEWRQWRSQIEAERLKYDTGSSVPSFQLPPIESQGPAAAAPAAAPDSGLVTLIADTPAAKINIRGASRSMLADAAARDPVVAEALKQAGYLDGQPSGPAPVAPASTGSPSGQAAAPSLPPMPPEIAALPKRAQDAWRLNQAKLGNTGGGASDEVVRAIIEGRMQLPSGFALRSPYWQEVIEKVAKQDPNFDAARYGARAAARRTFASGPEARNVTALNTVIGHLGTLDEAATALENGDIRVFNAVANRMKQELGDPRINNFETARQAVAEETMRVFRQVGASEREARDWAEKIRASGSPAQLRGTIATLGKLLESRVDAIGQQFERTVNQQGNPARIDPGNRTLLDRMIQGGGGSVPPPPPGFTVNR